MATRFDTSTSDLTSAGKDGGNRTIVIVGLAVAITVSVVAIIVAAVAISRPSQSAPIQVLTSGGSNMQSGGTSAAMNSGGKRIWTVAYGHDWGAYEYFDKSGYIKGFAPELVMKACEAGGMDCRLIWDQYTNCWQSKAGEHPRAGQGLIDEWYDACTGWAKTVERSHTFSFSNEFLQETDITFFVKRGNAASFNFRDLAGMKLVFMDGWAADEKCLARQQDDNHRNYVLPKERIIHVSTPEIAVNVVVNGTAAAVVGDANTFSKFKEVEEVTSNPTFNCYLAGNGMMTRKDSDFNMYFNVGLQKIKDNGEYRKLCESAKTNHGAQGDVNCLNI